MEQSTGLFDGSSDMFLIAMASLIGMLGVAIIVGLIYHYKIFVPLENKGKGIALFSGNQIGCLVWFISNVNIEYT